MKRWGVVARVVLGLSQLSGLGAQGVGAAIPPQRPDLDVRRNGKRARTERLTIPVAIKLPFAAVQRDNPPVVQELGVSGARRLARCWDLQQAKELLMCCSATWSDRSVRALRALLARGFAAENIGYDRGGLQAWRLQGLSMATSGR